MRISPVNNYQTQNRNKQTNNKSFGAIKCTPDVAEALRIKLLEHLAELRGKGECTLIPPYWRAEELGEFRLVMHGKYQELIHKFPKVYFIGEPEPDVAGETHRIINAKGGRYYEQAEAFAIRAKEVTAEDVETKTAEELLELLKPDMEAVLA